MKLRIPFLLFAVHAALVAADEPPVITRQPVSQVGQRMGSVTFSVSAKGTAPLTYRWNRNGSTWGDWNRSSLTLVSITENDVGRYSVTVSNGVGTVTSETVVLSLGAPVIVQQPADVAVATGGSATLAIEAIGRPPPTYQWQKAGANLPGATSPSLKLDAVQEADFGTYTVVVSNTAGSVTSRSVTLGAPGTLPPSPPPPSPEPVARAEQKSPSKQTPKPAGPVHNSRIEAVAGQPVKLTAAADGSPPFKFQWHKNGKPIQGATSATFVISAAKTEDAGIYTCDVSNPLGSSRSEPCALTIVPDAASAH